MKKTIPILTLLMTVMLVLFGYVPAWAKEKADIAMVLWRGMTEAENGFQEELIRYNKYDFNFTVLNAHQSKDELARIMNNLDVNKYRLIYSFGTTVTKTLKSKVTDKPIVFNIVSRPVKANIIDSWEHSGSNITGASNAVPMVSAFNTLSKVMYIGRLGFIYNPREDNSQIQRDEVAKLQSKFDYEMIEAPMESQCHIHDVIHKLVDAKIDAVLLPSDSFVKANANQIIPELNKYKIPSIVSIPAMVRDNQAFLGLGPNYYELGRLAANKAFAILDGRKPNDIPTSTLDRMHMTVNLTTAKEIGISVPVQILRISTVVR